MLKDMNSCLVTMINNIVFVISHLRYTGMTLCMWLIESQIIILYYTSILSYIISMQTTDIAISYSEISVEGQNI